MPMQDRRYAASGASAGLRALLVVACPAIAALTILATYLNKEAFVGGLWVALGLGGSLFIKPVVGIAIMEALYLLTAYPTLLQALGFLTISNLIGLCLGVLLLVHVLSTRDFSFLRNRQFLLFVLIFVVLLVGVMHSNSIFADLQDVRGHRRSLDRTSDDIHDYITRVIYLVFILVFVRDRRDVRTVFLVFMLSLFAAVPSALVNWWQGNLNRGFRTAASLTVGANPNKLAMICLMEIACWWYWSRSRPGLIRQGIGLGAIAASLLVLLASGSRSGLLGTVGLGLLLQTGPRKFRVSRVQIGAMVALGAVLLVAFVPAATWQRMTTFNPEKGQIGGTSNIMREETIAQGLRMFREHPTFGVGLGNFQMVSQQIYNDPYFRPPHNSYLWASAEGGILVVVLYVVLFAVTWRDIQTIMRLAHRDPEMAPLAGAVRNVFFLFAFFSAFADLWLTPIIYLLFGMIITFRRYLERLPEPVAQAVARPRRVTVLAAA